VLRCWSGGGSNRRFSLAFSPFGKVPKSGRFRPELADRPIGEHSLIGFSAMPPLKLRAFSKPQRSNPSNKPCYAKNNQPRVAPLLRLVKGGGAGFFDGVSRSPLRESVSGARRLPTMAARRSNNRLYKRFAPAHLCAMRA
jgi:hypothetical protein